MITARTIGYILKKFPVLSETFILQEILALEASGVAVHIFSLERPSDPRFHEDLATLKASITYLPMWSNPKWMWSHQVRAATRFGWSYFSALGAAILSGRPSVWGWFLQSTYVANHGQRMGICHLHSHYANNPATVADFTARITGLPYSFTAHAYDIFRMRYTRRGSLRALSRRIARARFVITISDFNQAYLRSIAPQSASKIRRLYNGIDLERFVPNGTATSGPFILLAVCRLVEKKGLGVLIEACRQLRDRQVAFQGWIVGAGRLQGQLAAQITAHRLDPYVQLLGPHTHREVLARYHAAHLFVLPCVVASDGDRDGLPAAIVEALACGLPVVTTPVTGIPEVVRHGHNGLLVQQGDGGALANAIEAVILDPALYERMRVNARTSVESIFDRRQTTAELARWFRTSMAEDVAER